MIVAAKLESWCWDSSEAPSKQIVEYNHQVVTVVAVLPQIRRVYSCKQPSTVGAKARPGERGGGSLLTHG